MKTKIDQEIEDFLNTWGTDKILEFLKDIVPVFELYDVDEQNDWVIEAVGEGNEQTIRLIRTAYLLSKIAEKHAKHMSRMNLKHRSLWRKMEIAFSGKKNV